MSKINIHTGGLPPYVIGYNDAYTEGYEIWLQEGMYDPYSVAGLTLIGHEVRHVNQYRLEGPAHFQAKYGAEYAETHVQDEIKILRSNCSLEFGAP